MANMNKLGKVATTCVGNATAGAVTYHQTIIARWDSVSITLNNGGFITATTKVRMNQASNQFELGYYVYQEKGVWYVTYNGTVHTFVNGVLTLER